MSQASKARADPEPAKRVTGAETHTANLYRYDPRVGAVRGKAACTVLRGAATGKPTHLTARIQ
jgi:hypothetical protein